MLTFIIIISVHIMHIWITFLSAIGNLDTFADGHRDTSKGMKVNKKITKSLIILYILGGLWAGIAQ